MIKLGQQVRCIVTGFTGIAISRVEYLNGCVQYCVKPPVKDDGTLVDDSFTDYLELLDVDEGVPAKVSNTGGPKADTPSTSYRG